MPATTLPSVPHYISGPVTQEDLDWAELPILDISKAHTPEGLAELAPVVCDAMRTQGFLYVVNHGLTQAQVSDIGNSLDCLRTDSRQNDRIFDIADVPFSQVSDQEKKNHVVKPLETGLFTGYKERQYFHIDNGVRDQLEMFQITERGQGYPAAVRPLLPEIRAWSEYNHFKVVHPLLRLLALGMELPEDTFVNMHQFEGPSETWSTFPRTDEDEEKSKNVWLKGHTGYRLADLGSLTILWSQPVSGLQVLLPDGKWRWVKHMENALVVNLGDSLEMLSGGFYKAAIHRVVQPPPDQRGRTRLGAFYFSLPDDPVRLVPLAQSPVFSRAGVEVKRRCADADAPTAAAWRAARVMAYGQTVLTKREGNVEEEVVNGVVVKHYN
ncbi:Clavaminate synthase-like protein [Epithele typhae]|uniref:Clavaminate synthase-like protein n=1 Tax=Epithele typhae TaxID=378194 RepID=UPI0020079C7A|nr:Clavaminate synthase-like protein [Epithele typhae]KAH9934534.1 Clavaminate synthase-like protein [Epithele typhae]